jgi:hypothetical protein
MHYQSVRPQKSTILQNGPWGRRWSLTGGPHRDGGVRKVDLIAHAAAGTPLSISSLFISFSFFLSLSLSTSVFICLTISGLNYLWI